MIPDAQGTNQDGQVIAKGSRCRTPGGRIGTVLEILQDGDADMKWDDGTYGSAKWWNLEPVK